MKPRPWILAAALALPFSPAVMAQPAATATTKTTRTMPEVARDIQACSKELGAIASSPGDLLDPAKRAEMGPKALPVLNRLDGLMQELGEVRPEMKPQIAGRRYDLLSMKALLGDPNAEPELKQATLSKDPTVANAGKSALLTIDWVRTAHDAAAQSKVIDRTVELANANPTDPNVAMLVVKYVRFGSASPENRARAIKIIRDDLKGPLADQLRAQLAKTATQPATSTPAK